MILRGRGRHGFFGVATAFVAGASLCLSGCLFGGGSETDAVVDGGTISALPGRVLSPSGTPAAGVVVQLFPSAFDPTVPNVWLPWLDTTDAEGRFVLPVPSAPSATLYAVVAHSADGALWSYSDSLETGFFDTLRLAPPRRLEFDFKPADSTVGATLPGVAFVPGTNLMVSLHGTGKRVIDAIPVQIKSVVLRFGENEFVISLPARTPNPNSDPTLNDTLHIGATTTGPGIVQ
jgi:hypothetical protein